MSDSEQAPLHRFADMSLPTDSTVRSAVMPSDSSLLSAGGSRFGSAVPHFTSPPCRGHLNCSFRLSGYDAGLAPEAIWEASHLFTTRISITIVMR